MKLIADKVTLAIAVALHSFDYAQSNYQGLAASLSNDAVITRYRNDPIFHAKVCSLTTSSLGAIGDLVAENAALKEQVAQLELEKEYRYVEDILRPIRILLKVAECAETLADNSEEMEGEDGRIHVGTAADFDELSDALDLLDELPDDKHGYVLGGAAKAAWALRDIIGDTNG